MYLAGIVTYNPQIKRLCENIEKIVHQVDKVIIVDNGSDNIEAIRKSVDSQIEIIENGENKGIAFALNVILDYALNNDFKWFLTLDQDSIVCNDLIQAYGTYEAIDRVAVITCRIQDRNSRVQVKNEGGYQFVRDCITSGSLCNTNIINLINGFEEKLFIDIVDNELCMRILEAGFRILKINRVGILHEMGKCTNYKLLMKTITVFNEPPLRWYYYSRNAVYVSKVHHNYNLFLKSIYLWLKMLCFEKYKYRKTKAFLTGVMDGLFHKMGKCPYNL